MQVNVAAASCSDLVKGIIESDGTGEPILLPTSANKEIMEKILEFCTYMVEHTPPEIEKPLRDSNLSNVVAPAWYVSFIDLDKQILFELALVSNALAIKPLLELTCAKIATLTMNKNVQETRDFFEIQSGFTAEEEAAALQENEFAQLHL